MTNQQVAKGTQSVSSYLNLHLDLDFLPFPAIQKSA